MDVITVCDKRNNIYLKKHLNLKIIKIIKMIKITL